MYLLRLDPHISLKQYGIQSPKVKAPPKPSSTPVPFDYENLLILLNDLGDTHISFGKLGRSFKLPQTASFALRAPKQIPFLYEEAYQRYPTLDALGDLVPNPHPTPALNLLSRVVTHLIERCSWPANYIFTYLDLHKVVQSHPSSQSSGGNLRINESVTRPQPPTPLNVRLLEPLDR
ncbi:hypothetical protein BC835DRAFT_1386828 [Cytidiella melzeri]|nr:hypothetical protein BC835DRAFT_1386828 [Cytidiella melzeri]